MAGTRIAQDEEVRVTVGVDTHKDAHVARAKDQLGRRLGEKVIPTTPAGYRDLLAWARSLGQIEAFGLEGTGSYGAALARHLRAEGHVVVEVIRPNRQARRRNGKSDPADADAAAYGCALRLERPEENSGSSIMPVVVSLIGGPVVVAVVALLLLRPRAGRREGPPRRDGPVRGWDRRTKECCEWPVCGTTSGVGVGAEPGPSAATAPAPGRGASKVNSTEASPDTP